jgi:hypothetical protein
MRAHRCFFILVFVLLIPGESWAHLHKAAVFGAPTWDEGSSLLGFQLSGELIVHKLPTDPKLLHPQVGLFVDIGANWGEHGAGERTQAAIMLGGRVTWGRGWVEPFVHVAGARVRTQDSAPNAFDTNSGLDVGGGFSFRVSKGERVYLRTQYDHAFMWGSDRIIHKYSRLSVGIELRIPRVYKCPCPKVP